MRYFLLPDKEKETFNDYKIIRVEEQDIASFLLRNQKDILGEGHDIGEILNIFSSCLETGFPKTDRSI